MRGHGKHSQSRPDQASSPAVWDGGFEPLLDSEEAAALLKIHPKTLQKLPATVKSMQSRSASSGAFAPRLSTAG